MLFMRKILKCNYLKSSYNENKKLKDRIYNIKNLKLTNSSDTQKGRFQIIEGESVIQAFRYNPDFKVDRGFQ
jgi:hypothetical protein